MKKKKLSKKKSPNKVEIFIIRFLGILTCAFWFISILVVEDENTYLYIVIIALVSIFSFFIMKFFLEKKYSISSVELAYHMQINLNSTKKSSIKNNSPKKIQDSVFVLVDD